MNSQTNNISQLSEWMQIYQNIEQSLNPGKKLIQLVACNPGSGTSTIAHGIAKSCADILGKTVLIIGSGLNGSAKNIDKIEPIEVQPNHIKGIFPISGQNYFYLSIKPLENMNLDVFGWRDIVQNEQMAKSSFDLTLVESPALSTSTTGLSIARHADAVILIVEAENTRWPELQEAKENITKVGGNILGIVVNKRRHYIPEWLEKFVLNKGPQ